MNKIDHALPPEALAVASQAVLIELLRRLAKINPALQHVAIQSLKTADAGLQSVAREQDDPCQKRLLMKAASVVQDMQKAAFGTSATESGSFKQ